MRTCYYELLGVDQYASDIELKKAYRKKALQYHPDKNDTDTTEIFSTIRAAYEVLSDPQERAWYDQHKKQILNDEPIDDMEYEVDGTVTGITTDEILMFFNTSLYNRIDDSPAGIYQIIGRIFSRLAKDEVLNGRKLGLKNYDKYEDIGFENEINKNGFPNTCDRIVLETEKNPDCYLFPIFGRSITNYEYIKSFYKKWMSFNTLKSFSWKDEYMYSASYDRRTKREVNKRNEKARQNARNEYNKTVKRFVEFVKKLDKRFKDGKKKLEEERKIKEKEKKNTTKKGQSFNVYGDYQEQSWQNTNDVDWDSIDKHYETKDPQDTSDTDIKNFHEELDSDIVYIFECEICNKSFKSQNQYDNHLNTKLHKKTVSKIRWQMKKESIHLGLDQLSDIDDFLSADEEESKQETDIETNNEELTNNSLSSSSIDEENNDLDFSNNFNIDDELAEIEKQLAEMGSDIDSDEAISNVDEQVEESPKYVKLEKDPLEMNDSTQQLNDVEEDLVSKPVLGKKARRREAKRKAQEAKTNKEKPPSKEEKHADELSKLLASLGKL